MHHALLCPPASRQLFGPNNNKFTLLGGLFLAPGEGCSLQSFPLIAIIVVYVLGGEVLACNSGAQPTFFSKASRELQTELDKIMNNGGMMTLSEKSAGAGHQAVSLHRDCVLVFKSHSHVNLKKNPQGIYDD